MKRLLLLTAMLVLLVTVSDAQDEFENRYMNTGLGFGFQVNEYEKDFGFGLNVTSPYFFNDKVAARLRVNRMYNENLLDSAYNWFPYYNASLGILTLGGAVGESVRIYGEVGFLVIKPNADLSDEKYVYGGYGIFGFEFFSTQGFNYFLEVGGVGTGAVAEKIPENPIYSNGLTIRAGLRFTLPNSTASAM